MRHTRRKFLVAASAAACLGTFTLTHAATFPSRPVRLIVPYAPGGLPDTVARIVGRRLSEKLGQAFVVENMPGAGGAVAARALARAAADGHTFLVTDGPLLAIAPFVMARPAFNAQKDFVPVSLIGTAPLYLAVHANVKANTLDELVALAKAKPGALTIGSAGLGSIHHLTAAAMQAGLGINITHVPFRGSGQSVPAMLGGHVDMVFASPPMLMGFVQTGQIRLIAVNSAKRLPQTPNVPTLAEKIPGFDFAFNVMVFAKPGTPQEVIEKMNAEIARVVKEPEVVEELQRAGVDPIGAPVQQTTAAFRSEMQRIAAAAQQAGLKPE